MDQAHEYEVCLTWQADRKGTLSSPILPTQIEGATPPDFPKGIAGIWSPEHLFVAAVCSCLMTTFLAVAENSKLDFAAFDCTAIGYVEKLEGKYWVSEITLKPLLTLVSSIDADKAERVLAISQKNCLISNSVKTVIKLEYQIQVG